MTKMITTTRKRMRIIIIIIIIIIKTVKFTNVVGYHKPQFRHLGDNVRVMLVDGLSYWIF